MTTPEPFTEPAGPLAAAVAWRAGRFDLACGPRTLVMGTLNVTPDSFSDGGRWATVDEAVERAVAMAAEGADVIDVGGESTRPGSAPVDPDEETRRVVPVIERLVAAGTTVPISVDTRKGTVAEAALRAGASIVNDVSGGADPALLQAARESGAGLVLMHMRGTPATMQALAAYDDVVAEVRDELSARYRAAMAAGIAPASIALDPGIGFAKTAGQNLVLLRRIGELRSAFDRPLLVGPSRKTFVGRILGAEVDDRLEGTLATVAWLVARGVQIVRVHDVRAVVRVCRMVEAIRDAEPGVEPDPGTGAGAPA